MGLGRTDLGSKTRLHAGVQRRIHATTLVRTAEILGPKSSVSEREIELWVEHLGPVWKKNENLMRLALVSWYRSMQAEGLKEAGSNKMEKFVFEATAD